jgi:OOP family OmpA-OmpF porin
MKNLKWLIAALALVAAPAFAQQAQDTGWYAGASVGQSTAEDACTGLGGAGISCDDKDTAWKGFLGYQVNRNFAVEFGYTNLGEVSASAGGVNASIESTAFEFVGLGIMPLGSQFSVYGKAGLYRAESEGRSNVGVSADEDNIGLTFGVGVKFDLSRSVAIRGEWQRYSDVGGGNLGESNVDVLSVGVLFKF